MNKRLALVLATVFSFGCISVVQPGRARTLGPGESGIGAALAMAGIMDRTNAPGGELHGTLDYFPFRAEGFYERGLVDRVELDLRASVLDAHAGVKLGAMRSGVLDVSVAPTVSFDGKGRPDEASTRLDVPAFLGARIWRGLEIDLVPQASWALDAPRWRPELLGGTVSLQWVAGESGARRVGIAGSWMRFRRAPRADPGEAETATYGGLGFIVQVGL